MRHSVRESPAWCTALRFRLVQCLEICSFNGLVESRFYVRSEAVLVSLSPEATRDWQGGVVIIQANNNITVTPPSLGSDVNSVAVGTHLT